MSHSETAGPQHYRCGTLTYTKAGLFALFAWLLWGDFCFTIMEAVVPSVLPLKLKELGCSNSVMAMIITACPGILTMTVCPWVSFKSDRYRSRWGRRIPFIALTMPFLCVGLVLLGLSEDISGWVVRNIALLNSLSPAAVTIGLIAIFMVIFEFFNMFVASVFHYLFNDVVPPEFLARFMGAFKIIGTGAGAIYNGFIFQHAESHMREILIGSAILYLLGFTLLCLMVREGKYPPPEAKMTENSHGIQGVKTFFNESFSDRFYRFRFLATSFAAAGTAISAFNVFFNREMGLTLAQIGYVAAAASTAAMLAMYFMAIFVDRWHPLRISVYGAVFAVLGNATSLIWIFVTLPGNYFFWLNLGNVLIGSFLTALITVAFSPCQMRIFPRSRYGQFCSAQAMLRSTFTVGAGLLAGVCVDGVKYLCGGSDFAYRFIHVWIVLFSALSAFFLLRLYREWYRLGGDRHFHPPAPWNPQGYEELPVVPIIGPRKRWLGWGIRLFDAIMGSSVVGIALITGWMYIQHATLAFFWYAVLVLPVSVAVLGCWLRLRRGLLRDIEMVQNGQLPRNGIPHHGMLIMVGIKFLAAIGIWGCQTVAAVRLGLESGAVAFGLASTITNLALIGLLALMCRIERGWSVTLDEPEEVEETEDMAREPAV